MTEPVTEKAPVDYAANLIISVYNDTNALRAILYALARQSRQDFEITVSEDGRSEDMAKFIAEVTPAFPNLVHLTQNDDGFRKNIALNRAIVHSRADCLIFIDGDCVPHHDFIRQHLAHLAHVAPGVTCAGRRVELGSRFSRRLTEHPEYIERLENPWWYLLLGPSLHINGVKNYEVGLPSRWLHRGGKTTRIVGCNFSCTKADILAIDGFNEDYRAPGIGEDSDIEWRLRANGIDIYNVKFLAPVYHLYHPRRWQSSDTNEAIFESTRAAKRIFCEHGIAEHAGDR